MHALSSAQDVWTQVLSIVRTQVTEQTYRTWFAPLIPKDYGDSRLTLEVPNPFFVDWLQEHHAALLADAAAQVVDGPVAFQFAVSGEYRDRALPARPLDESHSSTAGASTASGQAPVQRDDCDLNARFTFGSFVVGSSNEFCVAASEAVSQGPGQVYNPLFIYGGVGLGKTHCMHAIGNKIKELNPKSRVRYVSCEKFMNEMIQSIRSRTTIEFKQRFRSVDVLLVDDIQFLAGKESTQEEFFHTFNSLYDSHRQIVITSDRPPRDLPDVEERLVSRFNWGVVTEINPPDFETRVAILRRKAEIEALNVPDEVILLVAKWITNNVRELEGSLIRLSARASLTRSAITADLAADFLKDLLRGNEQRPIEMADVIGAVARQFDVSVEALKGKRRTARIAYPRQVAMYLTKQLTTASLVEIGRRLGGRDHTTVLYACAKIEKLRHDDEALERVLMDLTARLRPGFAQC